MVTLGFDDSPKSARKVISRGTEDFMVNFCPCLYQSFLQDLHKRRRDSTNFPLQTTRKNQKQSNQVNLVAISLWSEIEDNGPRTTVESCRKCGTLHHHAERSNLHRGTSGVSSLFRSGMQ